MPGRFPVAGIMFLAPWSMSLPEIIIQKIRKEGPISFRDYMDLCLYHRLGYYRSSSLKFGGEGDFFTSPTISPIFGKLIARQLTEAWKVLGRKEFTVMEWGGGDGTLAKSILEASASHPQFYDSLHYGMVERNSLSCAEEVKLSRFASSEAIPAFDGCVLSNEMVDNFPVHLVEMHEVLMEVHVDFRGGKFIEILHKAPQELLSHFEALKIQLPVGYRTEVNMDLRNWIKVMESKLKRGFVITFDYGGRANEIYHPNRNRGTLLCFHRHKVHDNPYVNMGQQDITASVDFTSFMRWGEELGLSTTGYVSQLNFLRALGLNQFLHELEKDQHKFSGSKQQNWLLQHFIIEMGNRIKVLVQHKGVDQPRLSGLMFSKRDPVEIQL